jgi:hypothetical protein
LPIYLSKSEKFVKKINKKLMKNLKIAEKAGRALALATFPFPIFSLGKS